MASDFRGEAGYPIGLRNNNPGNLRTGETWQGAVGSSGGFVTFKDMNYGIRAAATVLVNNISSQGNDTIRKLITKYAPPSENDTDAYISAVVFSTGIGADEKLTTDADELENLLHAIFTHENGAQYADMISDEDIQAGIALLSPQWLAVVKNFFAENPVAATAGGLGIVIVVIALLYYFSKNIKIKV